MINPSNQEVDHQQKNPEEVKAIRKIMTKVLKKIASMKLSTTTEIIEEIVKLLTECGYDIVTLIDEEGNTLAHLCVKESKSEALKIIVKSYIKILTKGDVFLKWLILENNEGLSPITLSAQKSNKEIIKFLYETIESNEEQALKITAKRNNVFHNAAKKNQCFPIVFFFEKLQKKYQKQLVIDIPNQLGITPLHYACFYGSKKAMDLFIDLGANINETDVDGNTPLHFAVKSGSERAVKKLLVRGADKHLKNKDGLTPYDIAMEINNGDLANILLIRSFWMRLFGKGNEIGAVSGSRNNLMLVIIVMGLIFCKVLIVLRFVSYIEDIQQRKELIPGVKDIVLINSTQTNSTSTFYDNEKEKGVLSDVINCFTGKKCIGEITVTFISMIIDNYMLFIIIYFLCFAKKVYLQKKSKKEVKSLSKLFEQPKDVCVKCRLITDPDTVHCLVCNACVENWDHHCFWLNTCISTKNKTGFNFFFYSMFVFCNFNIIFFALLFGIWFRLKEEVFFKEIIPASGFIPLVKGIGITVSCFMILFCAYASFFIIM